MLISSEVAAMQPVLTGKVTDRSVVGIMVDFAKAIPFYVEDIGIDDHGLGIAEKRPEETPCYAGRSRSTVFPLDRTPELLTAKWAHAG